MKTMKWSCRYVLVMALLFGIACPATAAQAPSGKWDHLLDVTYKFSWYPRSDLQKLLKLKATEYGQDLESYRGLLLGEITGGAPPTDRIQPENFVSGKPWRSYLRLSLAEFCLYLTSGQPAHLQNAQAALSILEHKTDQPEVEFWHYVYKAHQACREKNREAFIEAAYDIWQNVILRFEAETLSLPGSASQAGFVGSLPYLYENLAQLVLRKAILEQEIPDLYPLSALVLDIQPKMSVKNGYRSMVDQVVERMHGPSSDNKNLNFAVALIEATSRRYDFEDEKDPAQLPAKFTQARKYYQLAATWADTSQGKTAILTRYMGFLNYILRRFGDHPGMWKPNGLFQAIPDLANDQLANAIGVFDRLASPVVAKEEGKKEGFENSTTYLQALHQLWDSSAKLAIVLSDFNKNQRPPGHEADIFSAARPLEQVCNLFARYAPANPPALPDNAYFLTAFAAKKLGTLYRQRGRYSIDSRDDAIAFAYQLEAAELFPLDLPGILQMAFQSSQNGQVRQYFHYARPLATRLRAFTKASAWTARNPTDYASMLTLVPSAIPKVIDNPYALLENLPPEELSEDALFARAVALVENPDPQARLENDRRLVAVGQGNIPRDAGQALVDNQRTFPFFKLKSQLYGAPDSSVHQFLRILYNEVPYADHAYVGLLKDLQ